MWALAPAIRQRAPVCSVLGKTYGNECLLHKEACRKRRRTGLAHSGPCLGKHTQHLIFDTLSPRCSAAFTFNSPLSHQGKLHRGRVGPVSISSPGLVPAPESNGRVLRTCRPAPELPQPRPEGATSRGSCGVDSLIV